MKLGAPQLPDWVGTPGPFPSRFLNCVAREARARPPRSGPLPLAALFYNETSLPLAPSPVLLQALPPRAPLVDRYRYRQLLTLHPYSNAPLLPVRPSRSEARTLPTSPINAGDILPVRSADASDLPSKFFHVDNLSQNC